MGKAVHDCSSVRRRDSLPIMGNGDKWLVINCALTYGGLETNCIPPYYYINFAVPKGLKIVLVGDNPDPYKHIKGWRVETYKAVGRAAALGLSGLIVYDYNVRAAIHILKSFVSALQEQKEGEFESPLEILSLHRTDGGPLRRLLSRTLCNLREQFALGKLRNLKHLNMGCVSTEEHAEDFGLREVPYACPDLQILELGWGYNEYEYPAKFQCPDNVYGSHNCLELNDILPFPVGKTFPQLTGIYTILYDQHDRFATFTKEGSFPSLKVLICGGQMREKGLAGALAIGCPALRFLQIDASDLYVDCHVDWHGLLKRLFVLIVHCFEPPRLIFETGSLILETDLFPVDCELRAMTIVYSGPFHYIMLCLEELLRIKNMCLPKLEWLNVVMLSREHVPSETEWLENLKRQFGQKLIDFVIYFTRDQMLV